jgi:predicted dehydrogenase
VFITSTGDAHGTNRLEIQMDKAKLVVENGKLILDEYEMTEQEFSATSKEPFATVKDSVSEVETDGKNPQHIGVINAFADAILNGGKLVADGREGIFGLTLSNAMHLSAFLGKEVEIPFDEDIFYDELMKRVATSRIKTNVKQVYSDTSASYAGNK